MSSPGDNPIYSSLYFTALKHRLRLVRLSREQVVSCAHSLIKLFFYPDSPSHLVSYTEIEDDTSLILDEGSLEQLEPGVLPVDEDVWRAIQVHEGAAAIGEVGLVSAVATPLAQAGITMMYLSTFENDLILVPDESLDEAVTTLRQFIREGEEKRSTSPAQRLADIVDRPPQGPRVNMMLTTLDYELHVASLDKEYASNAVHVLLKLLMYPKAQRRFFHLIHTPTEVSLILESRALDVIRQMDPQLLEDETQMQVWRNSWQPIRLSQGALLSSSSSAGMVGPLAACLARNKVSIYYLSANDVDFVLVEGQHADDVLEHVKCDPMIEAEHVP